MTLHYALQPVEAAAPARPEFGLTDNSVTICHLPINYSHE
jgi:hypothetical protein